MYCSLLRVPLAGEFTISSFLLVLMHLPLSKSDKKHKFVSKLHFFFLFPSTNKIQRNYWDTASFKQPCLINTIHIWYVGEPSLVLHGTLFFFCKLRSFLLSPAKILLMSNKCIKYVYIVLLCLEWPRRVPAVCINTTYILGVLCLCPQLISAVSFSTSISQTVL